MLMRVLQQVPPIAMVDKITKKRANDWYSFFAESSSGFDRAPGSSAKAGAAVNLLINDPAIRSDTVIAVEGSENSIKDIKQAAYQAGIILGNGYGDWKNTTFRIANFPAISDEEIGTLMAFLRSY